MPAEQPILHTGSEQRLFSDRRYNQQYDDRPPVVNRACDRDGQPEGDGEQRVRPRPEWIIALRIAVLRRRRGCHANLIDSLEVECRVGATAVY